MKILIVLLFLFLSGCAATQKPQQATILMNSQAKIQYYQEQVDRYNFLIDQERKKIAADEIRK